MNGAILAFRRFEDPSLEYAGARTNEKEVGLFDQTISRKDALMPQ